MNRRQWLCDVGRLALLRWRVVRGRALPVLATALLQALDEWSVTLNEKAPRR